ncbi:MAG: hypothetical protein ACXW0Z_08920 [Gemmatirosa sp.]
MIAKGVDAVRAIMPVALRIAGAGVIGAAIGGLVKRAGSQVALPSVTLPSVTLPSIGLPSVALGDRLLDVWEWMRALGELPVSETARRLAAAPSAPIAALLASAVVLMLVAASLWRRSTQEDAGDAVDGAPASSLVPRMPFAMPALSRRLLQRRTATPRAAREPSLVPTLAATGADRAEIARRTGLSRDAVALSLSLSARQG